MMTNQMYHCAQSILPKTPKYFKEEMICDVLNIPAQKLDMERLLDVMVWPEVMSMNVIETPKGVSHEGQKLTGIKLSIELNVKSKLTYVADEPTQSAHAAHYETLKSVFVVLPEQVGDKKICELIRADRIVVIPYVESVCARMLDARAVYQGVMLFVDVQIC
ncbi:MAG: hypothetical protein RR324_02405 [Cellulosilyticaceae bacterium]